MSSDEKIASKAAKKAAKAERKANNRRVKEEEDHRNKPGKGIVSLIVALIIYVALPLVVIYVVIPMDFVQEHLETDAFIDLMWKWLYVGIPLVILAFPKGYYAKGSNGRLLAWVLFTGVSIFWLFYILNFGDLTGLLGIKSGDTILKVDIIVTGALLLSVAFKLLKLLIVACDHHDHREGYLRDNGLSKEDDNLGIVGGRYSRGDMKWE
jgi:hypothetical protein